MPSLISSPIISSLVAASDSPLQGNVDDHARRFVGIDRVYGTGALARAAASHVVVVGIGGVGSWAAEALARSGVGRITLIDLDHIAASNINRQVHALEATLGAAKVLAMAARIEGINHLLACRCLTRRDHHLSSMLSHALGNRFADATR